MSEETNIQNLTLDEILELKAKQITFMKEQMEVLEIQENYSRMKCLIAQHTFEETLAKVKLAQLRNPQQTDMSKKRGSDNDIDKEVE